MTMADPDVCTTFSGEDLLWVFELDVLTGEHTPSQVFTGGVH